MSWDIEITAPEGYPDVQEPIQGFSKCSGNLYMGVLEMKEKQLRYMEPKEAITALIDLINELDKGNDGRFSDTYAVEADQRWSEGKESRREWEKYEPYLQTHNLPFKTYEQFCSITMRGHIRESAVRFLLYYTAGYKIEYEW
jgi:hypothetical protein